MKNLPCRTPGAAAAATRHPASSSNIFSRRARLLGGAPSAARRCTVEPRRSFAHRRSVSLFLPQKPISCRSLRFPPLPLPSVFVHKLECSGRGWPPRAVTSEAPAAPAPREGAAGLLGSLYGQSSKYKTHHQAHPEVPTAPGPSLSPPEEPAGPISSAALPARVHVPASAPVPPCRRCAVGASSPSGASPIAPAPPSASPSAPRASSVHPQRMPPRG